MQSRILLGDTERIQTPALKDGSLVAATGLGTVLLSIQRVSDDFWYDFNDDTFKAAGWTTRQQVMTQVSATLAAGEYYFDWDTSSIVSPAADDTYMLRVDEATTAVNVPLDGEIKIDQWVADLSQQATLENTSFGDAVSIDTANGAAGTAYPLGTPTDPVDNLADALTIAAARGLRRFVVAGSITLAANLTNWRVEGVAANNLVSIVNLGGFSVAGTEFKNVALSGTSTGFFTGHSCEFFGTLNGIQGIFDECTLLGTLVPAANADIWLLDCHSGVAGAGAPVMNLTNMTVGGSLSLRGYSGGLDVQNCNVGAFVASLEYIAGQVILAASLTAGSFSIRGVVQITDNSAGATIITEAALARTPIQSLILNDATPFPGANVDAAISSRSSHAAADVWAVGTRELTALTPAQLTAIQSEILADATPFNGADIAAILLDTGTTLPARLTGIEGAGFVTGTDSLEAIRDQGDAAWLTAVGFSTLTAQDVWDELLSGLVVAGSTGEALGVLLDIIAGDTRITNSGLDWVEEHLDFATGLVVQRRYDLFGFDAGQITDTNNPFTASGISRDTGFMSRVRTL